MAAAYFLSLFLQKLGISKPRAALDQMDSGTTTENHLMLQFFEWDSLPPKGISWWQHFENEVPYLAKLGCTQVWLPPPNKAMVPEGRGYDAYDLVIRYVWDLGEFNQKGVVSTRWGTKEEFLSAIRTAKANGIGILIDAVLNHKLGADRTESFMAVEVDPLNRRVNLGPPKEIDGWTAFDFKGRGDKYSTMKWTQEHFTGVDWDQRAKKKAIYKIVGNGHQGWSKKVDGELGNYDYLLGIDVDFRHPDVRTDFLAWGSWILKETGATGFRLDACKHIDRDFLRTFVKTAREEPGYDRAFIVAEFWVDSVAAIEKYMTQLNAPVSMFDVPLHHNFFRASKSGSAYDLRRILDGSLVKRRPKDAVTFVDNHDTAIGCSLESWVGPEFKPLAYALILLRQEGHPCVYHADLYGPGTIPSLPKLMTARRLHAYGPITDYFDAANCIGFVRHGDTSHPAGCVVLCANAEAGDGVVSKEMRVGPQHAASVWRNLINEADAPITIAAHGAGVFTCPIQGVAVWVKE